MKAENIVMTVLALGLVWALHVNSEQGKSLATLFERTGNVEQELAQWEVVEEEVITIDAVAEKLHAGICLSNEEYHHIQQQEWLSDEMKSYFAENDMKNCAESNETSLVFADLN